MVIVMTMKTPKAEKQGSESASNFDKQELFKNLLKVQYPIAQDTNDSERKEQDLNRLDKELTVDELIEKYANEL